MNLFVTRQNFRELKAQKRAYKIAAMLLIKLQVLFESDEMVLFQFRISFSYHFAFSNGILKME